MAAIQMKLGYESSTLELPNIFIDHYLIGCAPVYPLIYIFSLRRLLSGSPVSMQEIAQHFQLLATDVVGAWRHWERVGLVKIDGNDSDMSITFLTVDAPKPSEASISIIKEDSPQRIPQPEGRPQYTVQELSVFRSQSKDIERLFKKGEQALGKLLTYNDMNVLFGFHDWLRLPLDVIEYLLHYSTENGQRSLRYRKMRHKLGRTRHRRPGRSPNLRPHL